MNDVILEKTDQFNRGKKTASVYLNTEAAKKSALPFWVVSQYYYWLAH